MSLQSAHDNYTNSSEEYIQLCSDIYSANFEDKFSKLHSIWSAFKIDDAIISDSDLEYILVELPLQLIEVSELLSQFKLKKSVLKIDISKKKQEVYNNSIASSDIKKREEANLSVCDDNMLVCIYDSIISRVESELSYSRELIMGAKKVWDSRKQTYNMNPVNEVSVLPEYDDIKNKTYIK